MDLTKPQKTLTFHDNFQSNLSFLNCKYIDDIKNLNKGQSYVPFIDKMSNKMILFI